MNWRTLLVVRKLNCFLHNFNQELANYLKVTLESHKQIYGCFSKQNTSQGKKTGYTL